MKNRILIITLILMSALISGCIYDEPDEPDIIMPADFGEDFDTSNPDQEYINNTIELWRSADKIEWLQTGEMLKINDDEYEMPFGHKIIVIPDNIEQRVVTCDYQECGKDNSILIGDNPCNYTNYSTTILFLNLGNSLKLYNKSFYNCPYLWIEEEQRGWNTKFYTFGACDLHLMSMLSEEDFEEVPMRRISNSELDTSSDVVYYNETGNDCSCYSECGNMMNCLITCEKALAE